MKVKAHFDSFNFSSFNMEAYFTDDSYLIETVKSIGVFEPHRWIQEFKKTLSSNIIEAKILHTSAGLTLPVKRFSSKPLKQTLELAGLKGYSEKSKFLLELLKRMWKEIQDEVITRIDVAIDFKGKVPTKVIKELSKSRTPFKYLNTVYSKTKSEKKTNPHLDIKVYNKALHANLDEEMERLEFCFKGGYFRGNLQIKDLDEASQKMSKTIKRMSGLDVDILTFKDCYKLLCILIFINMDLEPMIWCFQAL